MLIEGDAFWIDCMNANVSQERVVEQNHNDDELCNNSENSDSADKPYSIHHTVEKFILSISRTVTMIHLFFRLMFYWHLLRIQHHMPFTLKTDPDSSKVLIHGIERLSSLSYTSTTHLRTSIVNCLQHPLYCDLRSDCPFVVRKHISQPGHNPVVYLIDFLTRWKCCCQYNEHLRLRYKPRVAWHTEAFILLHCLDQSWAYAHEYEAFFFEVRGDTVLGHDHVDGSFWHSISGWCWKARL